MRTDLLHVGRKVGNACTAVFGLDAMDTVLDPDAVEAIVRSVERRVWGEDGVDAYEASHPRELQRLMRRSLAQFFAQRRRYRRRSVLLFHDLLSILALPFLLAALVLRSPRHADRPVDRVVLYHYDYLYPLVADMAAGSALLEEFPASIRAADIGFLVRACRAEPRVLREPRFLVTLVKWIGYYGAIVRAYSPATVVNFFEGSFVSSAMTAYLRERHISHWTHMHGEHFLQPQLAFSEFDSYLVFGEFWKELLERLRCRGVFVLRGNPLHAELFALRQAPAPRPRLLIVHTQTLRPRSQEAAQLLRVLGCTPEEWLVHIRFHPNERSSGERLYEWLRGLTPRVERDPYNYERFVTDVAQATVVVGSSSVALSEAWIAGRGVILLEERDDVRERFAGSPNVLFVVPATPESHIENFLLDARDGSPVELQRIRRVSYVTTERDS